VSEVVDITADTEIDRLFPYVANIPWQKTGVSTSCAKVALYLVSPIVSIESTVQPSITAAVYAAGGPDYRLGFLNPEAPSNKWYGTRTVFRAEQQSCVWEAFKAPAQPFIDDATYFVDQGYCMSTDDNFDICSLAKRMSWNRTLRQSDIGLSETFEPSSWSSNNLESDDSVILVDYVTAPFAYYRGGFRRKLFFREGLSQTTTLRTIGYTRNQYNDPSGVIPQGQPLMVTTSAEECSVLEATFPWYFPVPFKARYNNIMGYGSGVSGDAISHLRWEFTWNGSASQASDPVAEEFISASDDFGVGYLCSTPVFAEPPV
jgi:hypothetical protein